MKKIRVLPLILIICLVLGAYTPSAYALDKPRLRSADGVILIDLYTGETLFELEPDTEHSIASLTKVMTCLLAVEAVEQGRVTLSEMIEAQPDCKQGMDTSSSNAGIEPGEIMSYKDYLYCAMVSSANEACIVLATYLEGSVGKFVQKMNARAQELGCQHTHFSDADGMLNRSEGHYSTPRDLSISQERQ
jgi:D-alanyl-D-alanine carboxypeptidase